jgi:hypothetical protein
MTANAYAPGAVIFNSGVAYMIDSDTHPTPTNIRILQSASIDLKATNKELFGQNIFPVAVGRSQIKTSGKMKFADYQPRLIRDFVGAGANNTITSAGQTLIANGEAQSVPGTSTYTITVTNSATWVLDLGVVYAATGIPLVNVASLTAAGQYTYSAGVYTFYSGAASAAVLISYTWTTTNGDTVTISNAAAGAANTFQTVLGGSYNGLETNLVLYACVSDSLKLYDSKIGDFAMPELDFACFVNSAGNLGIVSVPVTS